jgi:hypothetical protein
MTRDRDRKVSLSDEILSPVLAINNDSRVEESSIRRSVSLSRLDEQRLEADHDRGMFNLSLPFPCHLIFS